MSLSDDVKVVVDHFNITMSTSRRRPKYFRTVIGGGQGGTTVAEQKKNKYNMLKLAALPHQPIGTKGNFIRKLKAKQKM